MVHSVKKLFSNTLANTEECFVLKYLSTQLCIKKRRSKTKRISKFKRLLMLHAIMYEFVPFKNRFMFEKLSSTS